MSSTDERPPANMRSVLAVVLGIVAVAAVISAVTAGGSGGTPAAPAPAPTAGAPGGDATTATPPEVVGEALPPLQDQATDAARGAPAPTFTASTLSGERTTVRPGQDGPMILLFLAHWCPHCQREVPIVQDWLDRGGLPRDVTLYAVATAIDPDRPNYPPDAWLEREGWTPTTVVDDSASSIAQAHGLTSFPFWVLVDDDGTVVGRLAGTLSAEQLDEIAGALSTARGPRPSREEER